MELTPRVGDRVLVRTTAFTSDTRKRTYVGDVTSTNETDVRVIVAEVNEGGWWPKDSVTVVDREPVEWPEGWRAGGSHIDRIAGWVDNNDDTLWFARNELERILATGPDMLARWDELMGES